MILTLMLPSTPRENFTLKKKVTALHFYQKKLDGFFGSPFSSIQDNNHMARIWRFSAGMGVDFLPYGLVLGPYDFAYSLARLPVSLLDQISVV